MTRAAWSVLWFGAYCLAVGAILIADPDTLLNLCGLPPAREAYIRVLGAVVFTLGLYYVAAARGGASEFFRWTVWGRPVAFVIFCVLVALGLAPPVLMVFGVVDAAGAIWTGLALRRPQGGGPSRERGAVSERGAVCVRPMTARDAAQVAALSGQLGYPSTPREIERRLGGVSRSADTAVLVAESPDGKVVGWAHVLGRDFLESDPYAELAGLVVDAAARRQGIGRALVSAAEAWAFDRGYAAMRVRSNVTRAEARPFYERMGYAIIKSQHVYRKTLA